MSLIMICGWLQNKVRTLVQLWKLTIFILLYYDVVCWTGIIARPLSLVEKNGWGKKETN